MMRVKKMMAAALCAALAMTAVGCGKQNTASDGDKRQIYLFMNNGAASAGSTSNDKDLKMVQEKVLQETGIEPVLINAGAGAEQEKLNVLLASGERIDAFWGDWPTYSKDRVIVPIGELIDQYGPDIKRLMIPDMWASVTDSEGKIWGIPRNPATASMPTFVRTDWLEKYGLSMPKTLEELETVLATFKEKDPAGNGATIPLVLQYTGMKRGLSAAFTGHGYGQWIDVSDNNRVKPVELHPGYKAMVEKVAEWYQKGYIDREGFSIKQAQVREQIKQNKVGMHMEWYSNITLFEPDLQTNYPGANYDIAVWEGPAGRAETITKGSQKALVVTKQCKAPEDVIKLINWGNEKLDNYYTLQSGIEGVHWDYANAEKTYIKERNPDSKTYFGDFNFALGVMEYQVDRDNPEVTIHQKYLFNDILDYDRGVKGLDYAIYYDMELMKKDIPTLSDINRMMEEEIVKFVTGNRPLTEWDSFIADLYKIGMDNYIDVYTREYQKLTN